MPEKFEDLWERYMPAAKTPEEFASVGWDMGRILGYLRCDELTGQELMDAANAIAAGLEERGLWMTPPPEIETLTLSLAHAASSYGRPVLLIDGGLTAYGPADMTPAGVTALELLQGWVARFRAPRKVIHEAEDQAD